jgi:hypothetical protein
LSKCCALKMRTRWASPAAADVQNISDLTCTPNRDQICQLMKSRLWQNLEVCHSAHLMPFAALFSAAPALLQGRLPSKSAV